MKATVKNNSGLMILVPKYGNGLMLFLEWVAAEKGCRIEKVIDDNSATNCMGFRINKLIEGYLDAAEYINDNL